MGPGLDMFSNSTAPRKDGVGLTKKKKNTQRNQTMRQSQAARVHQNHYLQDFYLP